MLRALILSSLLLLAACDNFTPRDKHAQYDPARGELVMPYPCPDWSQTQTHNYANEVHSNFGCATNTNTAAQLAYPQDLMEGHGDENADTEVTTKVIQRYRAGEIPVALTPQQTSGTGGQ